jgi:DNA-binding Lrp family transcriptional regulator
MKAYVLINAHVGDVNAAVSILRRTAGVISAYPTLGPYDIVSLVEGADLNELGDLVIRQIHAINEVVETTTCIVLNG